MNDLKIIWQEGLVTAEDISHLKPVILRFHKRQVPGDYVASCVVTEDPNLDAEVKVYGGRKGPDAHIKSSIHRFCKFRQHPGAYWWRCKDDRDPYQIWLYQDFPC